MVRHQIDEKGKKLCIMIGTLAALNPKTETLSLLPCYELRVEKTQPLLKVRRMPG